MSQYGQGGAPPLVGLQLTRRRTVTLFVDGNLAVANDVAEYIAPRAGRVLGVSIGLRSIGAVSGSTSVDVKLSKSGGAFATILGAVLSIAFGAASKSVASGANDGGGMSGAVGEPNGVPFGDGDVLRVDVTAIPGTTSAGLAVYLEIAETDF
jgi:hypothetical protein